MLEVESINGLYALSIIFLFLAYVLIHSSVEGYRKSYSWRWAIVLLLALGAYIQLGVATTTFSFIFDQLSQSLTSSSSTANTVDKNPEQ